MQFMAKDMWYVVALYLDDHDWHCLRSTGMVLPEHVVLGRTSQCSQRACEVIVREWSREPISWTRHVRTLYLSKPMKSAYSFLCSSGVHLLHLCGIAWSVSRLDLRPCGHLRNLVLHPAESCTLFVPDSLQRLVLTGEHFGTAKVCVHGEHNTSSSFFLNFRY